VAQAAVDMSAPVGVLDPDAPEAPSDVARAFTKMRKKQPVFDTDFRYYDGDQPVVYATDMLSAYFKTLNARFIENWCAPVIDAVLERLTLKGFSCEKNNQAEETLGELMETGGLELEAYDAHLAAVTTGESAIIVWPHEDDQSDIEVYYNDPRQVEVFYQARHPKVVDFAAKTFRDERTGVTYMTLYYADRLEHYRTRDDKLPQEPKDFMPLPEDEGPAVEQHDAGRVPVFHFRRNRRVITGELRGRVLPQQDMVNKTLADMMVSSEFAGFKQRWAIANSKLDDLEAGASNFWRLPPSSEGEQPTQVGQFESTDLQNFLGARTALAEGIAIISHTPKHYMTGAAQPSGEALNAMDAPLVKKVEHYQELFSATWRDLAVFYCQLKGVALDGKDCTIVWERPNIEQPETTSNVVKNMVASQMPLPTALREYDGWEPKQLEAMDTDRKEAAANNPPTLGEIALKAAAQNLNSADNPTPVPQEPGPGANGDGAGSQPTSPFLR